MERPCALSGDLACARSSSSTVCASLAASVSWIRGRGHPDGESQHLAFAHPGVERRHVERGVAVAGRVGGLDRLTGLIRANGPTPRLSGVGGFTWAALRGTKPPLIACESASWSV